MQDLGREGAQLAGGPAGVAVAEGREEARTELQVGGMWGFPLNETGHSGSSEHRNDFAWLLCEEQTGGQVGHRRVGVGRHTGSCCKG